MRRRSSAACELGGQLRVELLALAGQDCRVDRLREQGVAEAEAAGGLVGDKNGVLDRLSERVMHVALRARSECAEQLVADVASRSRGQAQQGLRRRVELCDPLQQQVAQAVRERTVLVMRPRREALLRRRDCLRIG